jgi:AbiV family abortive infection protein
MQEGIDKCKENIADYLKDAVIIADTGRLYHAIISLEFALEEFGKILLLKETMNNDKSDTVPINGNEFCNHNRKAERALKIIDPRHKFRVLFETFWERGFWEAGMWGETVMGDKTRLDCAFVDFIDNNWMLGRKINPNYIQDLVTVIEQETKKI